MAGIRRKFERETAILLGSLGFAPGQVQQLSPRQLSPRHPPTCRAYAFSTCVCAHPPPGCASSSFPCHPCSYASCPTCLSPVTILVTAWLWLYLGSWISQVSNLLSLSGFLKKCRCQKLLRPLAWLPRIIKADWPDAEVDTVDPNKRHRRP